MFPKELDDNLDNLFAGDTGVVRQSVRPEITDNLTWEACPKCRGTGQTRWGQCFKCKGAKGKSFKKPASERLAARNKAHARKEKLAADMWQDFVAAHPHAAAWIESKRHTYGFAQSMRDAVQRFGSLTDNQMAAVQRSIDKDAARATERADRVINAPSVCADLMKEAFDRAAAAGLKRINARIGGYVFTPAKATSSNPGAIYVKRDHEYLGKVAGGKFLAMRGVTDDTSNEITTIIADPKSAARAHGMKTGKCSCCGAELTNGDSIALGIGPICATRFGW